MALQKFRKEEERKKREENEVEGVFSMDEEEKRRQKESEEIGAAVGGALLVGATALAGYGLYKLFSSEQGLKLEEIGVNFNGWRKPKDLDFLRLPGVLNIFDNEEINLQDKLWSRNTKAVDSVLQRLIEEMKKEATKYEGLVLEESIKQGSAREGLKVCAADEFDVLLQFRIAGLNYEVKNIRHNDSQMLPELAYLLVDGTRTQLESDYPRLYRKEIFTEHNGAMYLNSRNLQEKVFQSIVASASSKVESQITLREETECFECHIAVRTNPPSVNIGIAIKQKEEENPVAEAIGQFFKLLISNGSIRETEPTYTTTTIDVDIVPGLFLGHDRVPDPTKKGRKMNVPRYAVFKWFTDNHRSSSRYRARPDLLWRICSSGYEKHVMDIAHGMKYQHHIITALRLLKLFFAKEKWRSPYQQVLTVLRSYHLKHLAFFCILFLRVVNKVKLSSAKEALAYLMCFLEVCLQCEKLPHFFHSNALLVHMFPEYHYDRRELRYNLFDRKTADALLQARLSMPWLKEKLSPVTDSSKVSESIVDKFRDFVKSGDYFE